MIRLEPRKMVAFASMLNCSGPRIHAPTQRGGLDIHTTHKPVFGMDSKMYSTYGDIFYHLKKSPTTCTLYKHIKSGTVEC